MANRYIWAASLGGDVAVGVVKAPNSEVAFAAAIDNAAEYFNCEASEDVFGGFVLCEDLGELSIEKVS